jgi:hypothetical protein
MWVDIRVPSPGTTADLAYHRSGTGWDLPVRRLVLGLSPRFASTGDEDDRTTKAPVPTQLRPFLWPIANAK